MFKRARLQLTLWYMLIIMIISLFFSVAIYSLVSAEIGRFASRGPKRHAEYGVDMDFMQESKKRLLISLTYQNLIILLISGSLSYFLAGKTLNPIVKIIEDQKVFISNASHELRTPLTALKSTFEVALRDSKLDLLEAKNNLKTGINGDPNSIEELFEIILDNSIKYSTKSPVTISSADNKIIVKDSGLGISSKDLPHIFDRFYRADNARSKKGEGGYGLGLPIAQRIMDKHGGKIIVDSKLGAGTIVQLVFRN